MKRLLALSTLLLLTTTNYMYADSMRMTVINDSSATQNLNFGSVNRDVRLGPGEVKMLTVDYRYPQPITLASVSHGVTNCSWTMPPIGKQTIRNMMLTISNDANKSDQNCLISWQ